MFHWEWNLAGIAVDRVTQCISRNILAGSPDRLLPMLKCLSDVTWSSALMVQEVDYQLIRDDQSREDCFNLKIGDEGLPWWHSG